MLSLQDVHALTPRTCDCYFTWQKGFPDMIKDLVMGRLFLIIQGDPT